MLPAAAGNPAALKSASQGFIPVWKSTFFFFFFSLLFRIGLSEVSGVIQIYMNDFSKKSLHTTQNHCSTLEHLHLTDAIILFSACCLSNHVELDAYIVQN